jgi:hypothetical protein
MTPSTAQRLGFKLWYLLVCFSFFEILFLYHRILMMTGPIMAPIKLVLTLALATLASGGSLQDVKHVVLVMFENRAFDHVDLFFCCKLSQLIPGSILALWQA